jgi:hypothetical protein
MELSMTFSGESEQLSPLVIQGLKKWRDSAASGTGADSRVFRISKVLEGTV